MTSVNLQKASNFAFEFKLPGYLGTSSKGDSSYFWRFTHQLSNISCMRSTTGHNIDNSYRNRQLLEIEPKIPTYFESD